MKNHSLFVYFRIILPAIIAVLLFFFTSFYYFLPRYEQSLLAEKKNQIHEMVQIAWHMIDHLNDEVGSGFYTLDEAKDVAKSHLRNMRYGQDSKDYFWINDFVPMLIMHPYRPDLEMQDLSDYADPNGTKLFMEFISTVNKQKEGYVP